MGRCGRVGVVARVVRDLNQDDRDDREHADCNPEEQCENLHASAGPAVAPIVRRRTGC